MIDEVVHRLDVLHPSPYLSQKAKLDHKLGLETYLFDKQPHSNGLSSPLMSGTTTISDFPSRSLSCAGPLSALPIYCPSSDRRRTYQPPIEQSFPSASMFRPERSPSYSSTESKSSQICNKFRNLALFQKRRPSVPEVSNDTHKTEQPTEYKKRVNPRPPSGPRMTSQLPRTPRKLSDSTTPTLPEIDLNDKRVAHNATGRTRQNSIDGQHFQAEQQERRDRMWEEERKRLPEIRLRHEQARQQKLQAQATAVEEARNRHDEAVASLDSRQLEVELQLRESLETERRTCQVRLKHMEKYCHGAGQNPTPPPSSTSSRSDSQPSTSPARNIANTTSTTTNVSTPSSSSSSPYTSLYIAPSSSSSYSSSASSPSLPLPSPPPPSPTMRTITPHHLHLLSHTQHHLANLDNLHQSRIQVLRRHQEKQYAQFLAKGDKDIARLQSRHRRELKKLDQAAKKAEEDVMAEIGRELGEEGLLPGRDACLG